MKNLLYVFIIIGLILAVIGIYSTFTERNKAVTAKQALENKIDEASKLAKAAEEERNAAVLAKETAEKQVQSLKDQAGQGMAESANAKGSIKAAQDERDKVIEAAQQAQLRLEKANADLKAAEVKLADAEQRKREAEARLKAEAADKELAQKTLDNEKKSREATEAEYRRLANVAKGPESVARFCSDAVSTVLSAIQAGDKHYVSACGYWLNANEQEQKMTALEFFGKARNYYNVALVNIDKLTASDKDTERIKSYLKKVTDDDIISTDSMTTLLNKILEDENEVTLEDRTAQTAQASKKKYSADNSTIDICGLILNLMDNNKDAFTKTQRENVENIKKEIETRLKPAATPGSGEKKH